MNKVILTGRITKDIDLRYTESNKAVCEFSIAINRIGQEQTDFINCVVWEKQAENLKKYQSKGSLIAVLGSMRVEKYQDKEGNNRYKTYVLVENIEYLETKKDTQEQPKEEPKEERNKLGDDVFADFGSSIEITDDDVAF